MIGISDKVWNKETIREELRKLCITYNNKMRCLSTSWVIERYQIVKKTSSRGCFYCVSPKGVNCYKSVYDGLWWSI